VAKTNERSFSASLNSLMTAEVSQTVPPTDKLTNRPTDQLTNRPTDQLQLTN